MISVTHTSKAKAALAAGDVNAALSFAAKSRYLGAFKDAIQRADNAAKYPDLYRQMKKDPQALIALGVAALKQWL